jgi:hypothetical protein
MSRVFEEGSFVEGNAADTAVCFVVRAAAVVGDIDHGHIEAALSTDL